MRWLVDECVDAALVAYLRMNGHDAVYMSDIAPRSTDAEVIARAQADGRLLLTEDKDFGDLVFRQAFPVPGLILLRIPPTRSNLKIARLQAAIEKFGDDLIGR